MHGNIHGYKVEALQDFPLAFRMEESALNPQHLWFIMAKS